MSKSIYINLPAKDVAAARAFYEQTGFSIKEEFSNEQNAFVIIDDRIVLMLVDEELFKQTIGRSLVDAAIAREVALAVEVANQTEVDSIVDAAIAAGAHEEGETINDEMMYSRSFADLDGHLLSVLCMKG